MHTGKRVESNDAETCCSRLMASRAVTRPRLRISKARIFATYRTLAPNLFGEVMKKLSTENAEINFTHPRFFGWEQIQVHEKSVSENLVRIFRLQLIHRSLFSPKKFLKWWLCCLLGVMQ